MNIMKQLVKSLYSPKDIAIFRFQGIGKTILFVFFLSLISVIPTSYFFSEGTNQTLKVAKTTLDNDLPPFKIVDGQLQFNQNTPLIIEKKELKFILDGTGLMNKNDIVEQKLTIALLKHDFVIIAGGKVQQHSYSSFPDLQFTNEDLIKLVDTISSVKFILLLIFIFLIYLFASGIKFIEVTILALIGLMLNKMVNRTLHYRHLWRMSAYSVVLATVFFTIMEALKISVPSGFIINWFVSIVVLTLALKETPPRKE